MCITTNQSIKFKVILAYLILAYAVVYVVHEDHAHFKISIENSFPTKMFLISRMGITFMFYLDTKSYEIQNCELKIMGICVPIF